MKIEFRFNRKFNFRFMNQKAEFAERLKQAMLAAGYEARPGVLERNSTPAIGASAVTFQAVSRWLKGEVHSFEQDKLQVLAEWLKIEPQALRFGEVTQFNLCGTKGKRWEDAIAGPEREVLEAFINLPAAQKKVAREVILALLKASLPD
jgi:transcriptional regulator with XRE-family HTH domain